MLRRRWRERVRGVNWRVVLTIGTVVRENYMDREISQLDKTAARERIRLSYIHLWRVRSMSVGNVKSWRRISIPGRGRVGELLVVGGVLHRPVVRVAHVHRSDDRGRWLQPLVSQQAGWVLSVCHRLQDCCPYCWHDRKWLQPVWWNLAEVGESLESSGSLWRGSRAQDCCHFSQDCNIIIIKYLFIVYPHVK